MKRHTERYIGKTISLSGEGGGGGAEKDVPLPPLKTKKYDGMCERQGQSRSVPWFFPFPANQKKKGLATTGRWATKIEWQEGYRGLSALPRVLHVIALDGIRKSPL